MTRAYFERSATVEADPKVAADMRAVAQADAGSRRRGAAVASQVPYCNSMMRTTCVATRLAGGHANNALPQLATANVNCRILPGVSPESVKDKLVEVARRSEDRGLVRRRRAPEQAVAAPPRRDDASSNR